MSAPVLTTERSIWKFPLRAPISSMHMPVGAEVLHVADQCGHGKLWKEPCVECEIIWLTHSLERDEPRVARDRAKLNQLLAERCSALNGRAGE